MRQPFDQTKRVYPQLPADTHPAVVDAFNDLHDHVFRLRDQIQAMNTKQDAPAQGKSGFTQEIQGIQVKAVTDPSSLQNGMSLKYNSSSGQWEPSM